MLSGVLRTAALLSFLLTSACGRNTNEGRTTPEPAPTASGAPEPAARAGSAAPASPDLVQRAASVTLHVPPGVPRGSPLLIALHGLGDSGQPFAAALGLPQLAAQLGVVWAAPDGTRDDQGRRFWNAGKECCDFGARGTEDVAFLEQLIARAERELGTDPKRVVLLGFSNGGFMAHRAACELDRRIAALVSIAGARPQGLAACRAEPPPAVFHVHGTADSVVLYEGGHLFRRSALPEHLSARESVAPWAKQSSCRSGPELVERLDLSPRVAGDETRRERFVGCRAPVESWTIEGGTHDLSGVAGQGLLRLWGAVAAALPSG